MAETIPISLPTFKFSVEAYHKLADIGILKETDKVELIEGKIVNKYPMKSPQKMAIKIPMLLPTYNFSVEAYHKLADIGILKETDKVELIEGKIITMSPINSPHAACVDRLGDILRHLFGQKAIIRAQNPIILGIHSEPEPDIAVVRYKEDYYEEAHPKPEDIFIVIEVSFSTQKYDRETKIPLFAAYNIPEAWLIDLKKKVIEVYQKPTDNGYEFITIFGMEEILKSGFVERLAVKRVIKK